MKTSKQIQSGFSLIEVVFALGLLSVGLVSVLALLSVGLKNIRESIDSHEAFSIVGGFPLFLEDLKQESSFGKVYSQVVQGEGLYLAFFKYNHRLRKNELLFREVSDPRVRSEAQERLEGLYYIVTSPSLNVPLMSLRNGVFNGAMPHSESDYPSSENSFMNASLAITVHVYGVNEILASYKPKTKPILIYETTLSR